MTEGEMIDALLERDPVSHADIVHILEKEEHEVLFSDRRLGIALMHSCGTVYAAPFTDDVMPLIEAIGPDRSLIDSHDEAIGDWYRKELGWDFLEPCLTYVYDAERGFLDEGPWPYRVMDGRDMETVREHYHFCSDDELRGYLERKDIFAMEDGKGNVMGFAGFHPEGSMGLLEIFPGYRRRGLGTFMESFIINEAMRRGRTPFCNVYVSNVASLNLQRDLGLLRGDILSYWVWPKGS